MIWKLQDIWVADYTPPSDDNSSTKEGVHSVWLNDGNGLLIEQEKKPVIPYLSPFSLVDIDNDGDIDMVATATYLNDGQGNFSDIIGVETGNSDNENGHEAAARGYSLAIVRGESYVVPLEIIDLNNDNKLDVIGVSIPDNYSSIADPTILDHIGDGSNIDLVIGINDPTAEIILPPSIVESFIGSFGLKTEEDIIMLLTGDSKENLPLSYTFHDSSIPMNYDFALGAVGPIATFVDVDNDGDLDAWKGNGLFRLYINDGTGHFTPSEQQVAFDALQMEKDESVRPVSMTVATGDIDGDGDQDAWVSTLGGSLNGTLPYILINDGQGQFSLLEQNSMAAFNSINVQLVDIDNDGDLDALEVNMVVNADNQPESKVLKIWLNDGTGQFTDSHKDIAGFFGTKVDVADLNNDGLKDIIIGNQIWFNGIDKRNSRLCDWAEKRFPNFFPKVKKVLNFIFGDWEYRYYPAANSYLGVNTKEKKVYVLGDAFGGLKEVGTQEDVIKMSQEAL